MLLRGVAVSGPITALAAASPRQKVFIYGRRPSAPRGGREEGPGGREEGPGGREEGPRWT